MPELGLGRAFQLGHDALGQDFTKLDAPLIERVDVPDDALAEDDVFIKRDQLAECPWRQPLGTYTLFDFSATEPSGTNGFASGKYVATQPCAVG